MTWSIIAHDSATGCFGIAVATKFFAAGARVPFIGAGIGAIATQALINPFYGTKGLRLLREGMTANEVVKELVAADEGRDHRQVHLIDASDRIAAHTGTACIGWHGHLAGEGFSVAGNMLVGAGVLNQTANTYRTGEATSAASSRPHCSSMAKKNGPILICASTITPSHWPSSSGSSA
jgi:uncharacterized Ntn-hydrolase superfamily protein